MLVSTTRSGSLASAPGSEPAPQPQPVSCPCHTHNYKNNIFEPSAQQSSGELCPPPQGTGPAPAWRGVSMLLAQSTEAHYMQRRDEVGTRTWTRSVRLSVRVREGIELCCKRMLQARPENFQLAAQRDVFSFANCTCH